MRAYHFVGAKLRDGRPVPPDDEWLVHDGPIVMCESGLHASLDPFDALQYAPGNTLCLVEIDGIEHTESDKLVCSRRKIVARFDAEKLLRDFAREQASSVLHLWEAPQIVKDWLATGNESLREAAREAAWAAALEAALEAARAAAWAAAREADGEAARAAAWAAAWEVAWGAALEAARAAAWAAAREADGEAARRAAWKAAREVARNRFAELVNAEFAKIGG